MIRSQNRAVHSWHMQVIVNPGLACAVITDQPSVELCKVGVGTEATSCHRGMGSFFTPPSPATLMR